MSEEDFLPCLGIVLGLMCAVGGLASFVIYQRQSEIGINSILLGLGLLCAISGYFSLSRENRAKINSLFLKLRLAKETLVTCVGCRSYVGQYEVRISVRDRMRVTYQVPNFSEGICMEKGRIIHDGYNPRRGIHFQQRRTQRMSSAS